ncbi:MAG: beta-lactamase family protein [Firmicutes bacterium]|nr:beta-lactamase family protein [Bacillota bacterium]
MHLKRAARIFSALCLLACLSLPAYAKEPSAKEFFPAGKALPWYEIPGLELDFVGRGITNGNVFSDSVLVLKGGEIVYERYAPGWDKDTPHQMYSVTKSVMSALVGAAIQDGKLTGVKQKVCTFFPGASIPAGQESKRDMTVEHLLTQTSGLPGDSDKEAEGHPWWEAKNTGKAAFEIPQVAAPGERFSYSSGPGMQCLAGLLTKAVGENLFAYAQRKLFKPLGMTSVKWDAAPDGVNYGGFGISMTPRDMLRLGYLYLNKGSWNGKQILPAWYVAATPPPSPRNWEYGYGYWNYSDDSPNDGSFEASGSFGNFICVLPAEDTVMVRTGSAGPATKAVSGLMLSGDAVRAVFMAVVYPLAPLRGIPLDYFMEAL